MLAYQHQWELEQKNTDDLKMPKVDKNNWAKTKELVKEVGSVSLAYVVQHHIKVHISCLDMVLTFIARAPIVNTKVTLKLTQE